PPAPAPTPVGMGVPESCNPFLTNRSILFSLQPHTFDSEEAKVAFTINHLTERACLWGTARVGEMYSSLLFLSAVFSGATQDGPHTLATFIDSGADVSLINEDLAQQLGIDQLPLSRPVSASVLDGHILGTVTHQTLPVRMLLSGNHHETIQLHTEVPSPAPDSGFPLALPTQHPH
ncbi:glutamate receptor ionotropic, NMDA 3B, partial [Lates japonicus]